MSTPRLTDALEGCSVVSSPLAKACVQYWHQPQQFWFAFDNLGFLLVQNFSW